MRNLPRLAVFILAAALLLGPGASRAGANPPQEADFERLLEFGRTLAGQGKHAEAVIRYWQIVDQGDARQRYRQDAEFELAQSLLELGLHLSAYTFLESIADAGEAHPHYGASLPRLLEVQRKVPGDFRPLEKLALYPPDSFPDELADELRFLVGQYHYTEGNLDQSLEILEQVRRANEHFYLRARYLIGVVHVRRNAAQPAVEAFRDLLRYKRESGSSSEVVREFGERGLLGLARIFYSIAGRFVQEPDRRRELFESAVRHYDEMARFSQFWLDALFEVSWAHYQLGNYGRALGNLHSLASPYFEEHYYPEAMVLQAVIFHDLCYHDTAIELIDDFIRDYWPLQRELENQIGSYADPNEFYAFLARLAADESVLSLRLRRIFNAALSDRKLSRQLGLVVVLNRELEGLSKLGSHAAAAELVDVLRGDVIAYRELVVGEAGEQARSRLQRVHADLKDLLAQALRVKFEALAGQKQSIDPSGVEGVAPRVSSEHIRWRFQGEYWRDELGSYVFNIPSLCAPQ